MKHYFLKIGDKPYIDLQATSDVEAQIEAAKITLKIAVIRTYLFRYTSPRLDTPHLMAVQEDDFDRFTFENRTISKWI